MRPLIIGPEEKAAIQKVVDYAVEKEHWYRMGNGIIPGDHPEYVAHIPIGFRCVFTFTWHMERLWRHLSVSIPSGNGKVPSPEATVMLARAFGFVASDDRLDILTRMRKDGWMAAAPEHPNEHAVVVIQMVKGK